MTFGTELENLKQDLLADNWKIDRNCSRNAYNICEWVAYKPSRETPTTVLCEGNEKPPPFCLEPCLASVEGLEFASVTFRLSGEVKGNLWVDLRVYSVPVKDAFDTVGVARKTLVAAWEAAHAASELEGNK